MPRSLSVCGRLRSSVAIFFLFIFSGISFATDNADVLAEVRRRIDVGQYQAARDLLSPYLNDPSARSDEVEYLVALLAFAEPDPAAADLAIRSFVKRRPFSKFAPLALYRLAQFYQVEVRNPHESIRAYSDYFMGYPMHHLSDKAHLGFIAALIDVGQFARAKTAIWQARAIHDYVGMDRAALSRFEEFVTKELEAGKPEKKAKEKKEKPAAKDTKPKLAMAKALAFRQEAPVPPEPPEEKPSRDKIKITEPVGPQREVGIEAYILVEFRNTDIDEILKTYSRELGLKFKKDMNVHGKISLTPKPRLLNRRQALSLLESVLQLKGYTMADSGDMLVILPAEKARKAGAGFVAFVDGETQVVEAPKPPPEIVASTAEEAAPDKVHVPTPSDAPAARQTAAVVDMPQDWIKIHTLSHANAERLNSFLQMLLARGVDSGLPSAKPLQSALIRADRMSNSIVVVGTGEVQEMIESLIQKLDYEGFSEFEVQIIPVKFARAQELAEKFRNIIEWENRTRDDSGLLPILIQADARMNALLLSSSSQRLMKRFSDLTAELDQPVVSPYLRQLENRAPSSAKGAASSGQAGRVIPKQ